MVRRPEAVAVAARLLVDLGRIDAVGGGWSVFWNELLNGAPPNRHRAVARAMTWAGRISTAHTTTGKWFDSVLSERTARSLRTEGAVPGRLPESVGGLARALDQL
jgi:hypothetical protein